MKKYQIIYAAPPWKYNSRGNLKTRFGGGKNQAKLGFWNRRNPGWEPGEFHNYQYKMGTDVNFF